MPQPRLRLSLIEIQIRSRMRFPIMRESDEVTVFAARGVHHAEDSAVQSFSHSDRRRFFRDASNRAHRNIARCVSRVGVTSPDITLHTVACTRPVASATSDVVKPRNRMKRSRSVR